MVVIVHGGILPGGVVAVTLADVVPGMALVLRAVIVLAAFPVTVALVPMVMSVIAATVVFVASPVHVVVPSFVSGVLPTAITAMACEPRGVALGDRTAVNSRLCAHIARKCDALGCALGSQGLHSVAFRLVIVRERVRHPVRRDLALGRIFVLMRMRMPPKHELLDDEEHAKPDYQGNADGMRSAGPHAFHRLRQ
jgi:hypothetical protein